MKNFVFGVVVTLGMLVMAVVPIYDCIWFQRLPGPGIPKDHQIIIIACDPDMPYISRTARENNVTVRIFRDKTTAERVLDDIRRPNR